MTFKINYTLEDGTNDYFVIRVDDYADIPGLRPLIDEEVKYRGGKNPWSEQID